MWHGVVTLFTRSLALEARWFRTHCYRLGFLLLIYCLMLFAQVQSMMVGAPGLQFFGSMLFLNAMFITLGGLAFFATAITEEKEEETIGLLIMAGINPLALLLGKSTSRLWQALLLLVVQFPFTLLAITLGGVMLNQVLAAYAALVAYAVLFANMGLLASVVSRRSGGAMGWTFLAWLTYSTAPALISLLTTWLSSLGRLQGTLEGQIVQGLSWIKEATIWMRLQEIQATGFSGPPINVQVVSNLIAACVLFLLSWAAFPRFALSDQSATAGRGLLSTGTRRWKWASPGRAWSNALAWKDFNFLAGGFLFLLLKFFGYGLLLIVMVVINHFTNGPSVDPVRAEDFGMHAGVVLTLLIIEASLSASRLFHDEVRDQTLVSLLILPQSIGAIAYSKLAGCLLGLVPALAWLVLDLILAVDRPEEFLEAALHPGVWIATLVLSVFLHLTVLLSLFVKWGALPLALFITLITNYCCPLLWLPLVFLGMAGDDSMNAVLLLIVGVIHVIWAFLMQMLIHARIYELGTK